MLLVLGALILSGVHLILGVLILIWSASYSRGLSLILERLRGMAWKWECGTGRKRTVSHMASSILQHSIVRHSIPQHSTKLAHPHPHLHPIHSLGKSDLALAHPTISL